MRKLIAALAAATTLLAGCSGSGGSNDKRPASAAVVVVSGGDAVSPFTTNDQDCATGLPAGNTNTAIRGFLLGKNYTVYTLSLIHISEPTRPY